MPDADRVYDTSFRIRAKIWPLPISLTPRGFESLIDRTVDQAGTWLALRQQALRSQPLKQKPFLQRALKQALKPV